MELITEIKQIVKEELGISEEVKKHVSEIFKRIITDAKTNGENIKHNITTGNFLYQVDSATINVTYKVIYARNMYDVDESEYIGSSDFLGPDFFELETTLIYNREENRYIDLGGTLQHEFEHIFQQIKAKKPALFRDSTRETYQKAVNLVNNATSTAERIVGYAVYYNNRFEKDAYANDLYKTIMDNGRDNPYAVLKNNVVYRNISVIKKTVLDKDNSQRYEPVVKSAFGKEYEWFLKLTRHMVDAYVRKMGKVLVKAMEDIRKENDKKYSTDGGRMSVKVGKPLEEE